MKKFSYFNGNDNYGEEYYPFNEFMPTGMVQEHSRDLDRMENNQRDGQEFDELRKFRKRRKRRLKRLKLLRELKNNKKDNPPLQPAPFYSTLYSTPSDFSGLYTSPLEYYNGTIIDGPDALTNPYNNTYQAAHSRSERIKIRAMIFKDYCKFSR